MEIIVIDILGRAEEDRQNLFDLNVTQICIFFNQNKLAIYLI